MAGMAGAGETAQGPNVGAIIQCEGGYLDLGAQAAFDNKGKEIRTFSNDGAVDLQTNFVQAVRSRKQEDLKTDIEQGHLSACLSHLGNIAHRIGKTANCITHGRKHKACTTDS